MRYRIAAAVSWVFSLLLLLALLLAVSPNSGIAAEPARHLFILSGQSNMARLDEAAFFTPLVADRLGHDRVLVVKDAQGGQPIRRWLRPPQGIGDLYGRLLARVHEAVQGHSIASLTFVWMQGERDARNGHSAGYDWRLRQLLAQLQEDFPANEIHLVIGRLSDHHPGGNSAPHWQRIRALQVQFAESWPGAAWVDTDDLNDFPGADGQSPDNGLHYTEGGYRQLGRRFALESLQLLEHRRQPTQPSADAGDRQ